VIAAIRRLTVATTATAACRRTANPGFDTVIYVGGGAKPFAKPARAIRIGYTMRAFQKRGKDLTTHIGSKKSRDLIRPIGLVERRTSRKFGHVHLSLSIFLAHRS